MKRPTKGCHLCLGTGTVHGDYCMPCLIQAGLCTEERTRCLYQTFGSPTVQCGLEAGHEGPHDYAGQRSGQVLNMLAARALVYCPRDLAEALARELAIPMPEGYFDSTVPGRPEAQNNPALTQAVEHADCKRCGAHFPHEVATHLCIGCYFVAKTRDLSNGVDWTDKSDDRELLGRGRSEAQPAIVHAFYPGDAALGQERECSLPVFTHGEWRHCGHSPEEHPHREWSSALPPRVQRSAAASTPDVELWEADYSKQCNEIGDGPAGVRGHSCTMTKGHDGPVHVEIDPAFGMPRYAWLRRAAAKSGGG